MPPVRPPSTYFGNTVPWQEPICRCRQAHTGSSALGTMQTWPNNEQSETDLVDYLFRILCLLFFEQVYCSCSLGIWILKRRPHWTSWVAFDQINTLRTSTSYARCAANEHRQVCFPRKSPEGTYHHGTLTYHHGLDGEDSPLS